MKNYLKPECIQIGTTASTKEDILAEVALVAKNSSILSHIDEEEIFKALKERERLNSTGFTDGIAIPHCRFGSITEFVFGVIVTANGLDFNSMDGKKTQLIFFIIAPEKARNENIKLLSLISRYLSRSNLREQLIGANSAHDVYDLLANKTVVSEEELEIAEFCMYQIALQRDEIVSEVLEILSSLSATITVLEGQSSSKYLHALPLFSTFWNVEEDRQHLLITGAINKKLVNEMIRSIDQLVEGIENADDISINVNELLFSGGSILS